MSGTASAVRSAADLQAIVFGLGDETYAIEIGFVHEIIRHQSLTAVPGAPAAILGLINLRSQVIPVLSLRAIFGLPAIAPEPSARIVLVGLDGSRIGILVDEVFEVRTMPADTIQPPPAFLTAEGGMHAVGIVQADRGLILLLDIEEAIASVDLGLTDGLAPAR